MLSPNSDAYAIRGNYVYFSEGKAFCKKATIVVINDTIYDITI